MISELISLVGVAKSAYDFASSIHTGRVIDAMRQDLEQLSKDVAYLRQTYAIRDITRGTQTALAPNIARDLLSPVQRTLSTPITSTALVDTPTKMKRAFQSNPWDVLFDIRPFDRAATSRDPSLAPFLFEHENLHFLGWQKKAMLDALFDCEYLPIGSAGSFGKQLKPVDNPRKAKLFGETTFAVNNHLIRYFNNHVFPIAGKEQVFYDGHLMSSKTTVFGGTHEFDVVEEGQRISYSLRVSALGGISIRRNGQLVIDVPSG